MKYTIITNNPKVKEKLQNVKYLDITSEELLIQVRDLVHKGYDLVSHPLNASKKLLSSPYRSVIVSNSKNKHINPIHLEVIENSIVKFKRHIELHDGVDSKDIYGYSFLDYSLLKSTLESVY